MISKDSDKNLLEKLELDKFIRNRLYALSGLELVTLYIALSRTNEVSLHAQVEDLIMTNMHDFSFATVVDLLYQQSKLRVAKASLMKEVINQVEKHSLNAHEHKPSLLAQTLVSMNLAGVSKKENGKTAPAFVRISEALEKHLKELSREELHVLSEIFASENMPTAKSDPHKLLVRLQAAVNNLLK